MVEFTTGELARMVGGRLIGPPDVTVRDVRELDEAGPGDLAFLRTAQHKAQAEACRASAILTPFPLDRYGGAMVVCDDAEAAMATVLEAVAERRYPAPEGISPLASVSPEATIGDGVAIGALAYVGPGAAIGEGAVIFPQVYVGPNCRIGARTVLHAGVRVHDGCSIGDDCIIHYNAVIGAEGFGFLQRGGRHVKLPQVGTVRIGDRVEIGAVTTVDRATLEATVIEDGVKIDNHCHIAHNCHIGPDCIMAGGSKLSGSVRLGRGVMVAPDVGVKDHVTVGDGAILATGAGVHADVPPGQVLLGYPARPISEQRRIFATLPRLPEMHRRLRALEKAVEALRSSLERRS